MDLTKRVGKNIQAIRKSQNLTIEELAENCDLNRQIYPKLSVESEILRYKL